MKYSILCITIATAIVGNAFGAASLRAPQIGGTATNTTPTANIARAGTMRTQMMKTSSVSAPSVTTTQSIATPVSTETTDARIALLKGIKGFNPGKIKDTTSAQQELNAINTRIEELQNKLDVAESAQVNIESKTYTKDEIDTLIAESEQKVPKIDERGNWTDPNGGLIVVPEGAVVIGPNDITIVDGKLSATSTHPIQNKTVTNAVNEKQSKSTTLSLGAQNGEWSSIVSGDNYIEIYEHSTDIDTGATTTGLRIKPGMISTDLSILANENQLVTATAVRNALDALTTNPGGGTQPEYAYDLINLDAQTLVTQYTYLTNAPYDKIVEFAANICNETISEKWCDLRYYSEENRFVITKRTVGYELKHYNYNPLPNSQYTLVRQYAANIPDDVDPTTYAQENFCAQVSADYCYIADIDNNFTLPEPIIIQEINAEGAPIYLIGVASGVGTPPF